tara:strand:+ start:3035 stop:4018 length:984 start_codon:yes stop_codon:yes gene_type:complete
MFIYYYNNVNEKVIVNDYNIIPDIQGYRVLHSKTGQHVTAHKNGKHVYMSNKVSFYTLDDSCCLLSSHYSKLWINEHDELWQHNSHDNMLTFRVCTDVSNNELFGVVRLLSERYEFDYHEAISNLKLIDHDSKTTNVFLTLMQNVISQQTTREKQDNEVWNTSLFSPIQDLKCNNVGNVGEHLIKDMCELLELTYIYEGTKNKNNPNGTFDIIVENNRVECKTARLGKHGSFQHETIRKEGCDFHLFVDISPNTYYITILPKISFEEIYTITGRRPHSRKGTNDVFKLDFSEQTFNTMISSGYTIHVNPSTTHSELKQFFVNHFKSF